MRDMGVPELLHSTRTLYGLRFDPKRLPMLGEELVIKLSEIPMDQEFTLPVWVTNPVFQNAPFMVDSKEEAVRIGAGRDRAVKLKSPLSLVEITKTIQQFPC